VLLSPFYSHKWCFSLSPPSRRNPLRPLLDPSLTFPITLTHTTLPVLYTPPPICSANPGVAPCFPLTWNFAILPPPRRPPTLPLRKSAYPHGRVRAPLLSGSSTPVPSQSPFNQFSTLLLDTRSPSFPLEHTPNIPPCFFA